MGIEVKIVADSVGPNGARLTTFQLKYHRFIHDQLMTHRVFSRNASSMRAISLRKMIEEVKADPALPVFWGKEKKGMKAREELDQREKDFSIKNWNFLREDVVRTAENLLNFSLHKQVASRILIPYAWIHVIVTGTDWNGFFRQRCHKDAQPEIQVLAVKMARAYRDSIPRSIRAGDWHLPYVVEGDLPDGVAKDVSAARCARVSYANHDGTDPILDEDLRIADHLLKSGHMSPFEHQGRASQHLVRSGNFTGWTQYRQQLKENEDLKRPFDFDILNLFPEEGFLV